MNRKTKPDADTGVSPESAAPRPPRSQTAASRARRASVPAPPPAPPATDSDAAVTPESMGKTAAPKPRPKPPAPRTTRTQVKVATSALPSTHQQTGERPVVPAAREPSREAIAQLAFYYWQARGGRDGSADEDWLRAERELRHRAQLTA